MLKITGIIFIVIAGSGIGYVQSRKLHTRVKFLEQYLGFITYMETQIRFCSDSLINLLEHFDVSDSLLKFIPDVCSRVNNGEIFIEAWVKSIKNFDSEIGIKTDDIELINNFGKGLGISDIEGQITHCDLSRNLLETRLKEAREEKNKKGKLYQMLGICAGVGIALLII